jgi:hypothetical protein
MRNTKAGKPNAGSTERAQIVCKANSPIRIWEVSLKVPLRLNKIAKVRVTAPNKTWIRSKKVISKARDSIPSVFH